MSKLHGNKIYIIIHNNGPAPLNFDSFSHFSAEYGSRLFPGKNPWNLYNKPHPKVLFYHRKTSIFCQPRKIPLVTTQNQSNIFHDI